MLSELLFGQCLIVFIKMLFFKVVIRRVVLKNLCSPQSLTCFTSCDESLGRVNSRKHFSSRLVESIYRALSLLDFDQVSEIPSELLSHIEVVCHILTVNKLTAQDGIQCPAIVDLRVASDEAIVVRAMAESNSLFIFVREELLFVDPVTVYSLAGSILGLYNHFSAVRFQKHVYHHCLVAHKVGYVVLV